VILENSFVKNKPRIGTMLRAKRKEYALTLDDLAQRTGLSRGFLSQVENNKASPSLSSLVTIAHALDSEVTDFLFVPRPDSIASYAAHRQQYKVPDNEVTYERTTGTFDSRVLNGLIITIPPGYVCELQTHEGEEMYLVLEGSIFCEVDGKRYDLNVGDTIHFGSDSRHRYGNPTKAPSRVMWVGTLELFGEPQDNGYEQ
jgi:transcriptional regulator with XRE-family HTH domain